jgi:hypothetical protein
MPVKSQLTLVQSSGKSHERMDCPGSRISDPTTEDKLKRTLSYTRQHSPSIVIESTYRMMSHSLLISYRIVKLPK